MTEAWKPPVAWFALFNVLVAPFVGRAVWLIMTSLNTEGSIMAAVGMSLVGALGILAVNVMLTVSASRAGLPRQGQMALWLITGGTFALTIGTGMFSPLNLLTALFRTATG